MNRELLNTPISDLEFSVRVHQAFLKYEPDMKTIGDLIQKSQGELLRTPNFGRKSIKEVVEVLRGMGLTLGTSPESIPPSMDKVRQDFVYNIIEHASSAASKSLEVITEKKEWYYNDIETYFKSHEKIMQAYKEALQRLHD
tara:strand:- start:107 stop:529 length:423 start_codon:yes stop_codon:yes gene_type:complete